MKNSKKTASLIAHSSIAGNLSRIMLDCTIGIAIYEKYADKAKRKAK